MQNGFGFERHYKSLKLGNTLKSIHRVSIAKPNYANLYIAIATIKTVKNTYYK